MKKSIIPEVRILKDEEGNPQKREMIVNQGNRRAETAIESPIIFISEYKGYQVSDDEGIICRFSPFSVNHPTFGQIAKGQYVCHTKETFDRLINHPALDSDYVIVKRLPRETDRSGNILHKQPQGSGRGIHELDEKQRAKYRRLVHLEASYFTKESDYKQFRGNVKSEATKDRVLREMDAIRNELQLERV